MPVGDTVLVIPLGEASPQQVECAVRRHFAEPRMVAFDRHALRSRPLRTLLRLWAGKFNAAVLVAPDLAQPRLRLTSLLLLLTRAGSRWRVDLQGGCERWSPADH
ncbi:MAG TPA: hypothetical protein VGK33_05880, partial [Chloroflexota bacterium]